MDIAYDGTWGSHPWIISLAHTGEVISIVNRSGNRPSHEDAAEQLDLAILLCRQAGFLQVSLRGETDFTQTTQLDAWDTEAVTFLFGSDAMPNLTALAEDLPASAWSELQRPPHSTAKGPPRKRLEKIKDQIVRPREFETLTRLREDVAEVAYQPTACQRTYRLIIVRQTIAVEKGQTRLFEEIRSRFYLSNDRKAAARGLVFQANDRCNQENLIAQLKSGVRAACGGGQPGEQLGVQGDDEPGVEPEGLVGASGSRAPPPQGTSPGAEAAAVDHGVQALRQHDHPDAVPDHSRWAATGVPAVVVERVAGGVSADGSCVAVWNEETFEAGIWMSRSATAS